MATPLNYRGWRLTKGDATGAQLAILVPTDYRVVHFASAADEATDWNVANPTHPTFYIHSETTPATDYASFDHDATDFTINVASGSLKLAIDGTDEVVLTSTAMSPATSDGNALGTTSLMWADLFLASAGVINWDNGDVTLTHSANILTVGGGDLLIANGFGVVVGHTAQIAAGAVTSELQVLGTAPADSTMLLSAWSADAVPPRLYFAKSRGTAIGTFSIITTGDNLGEILAFGDDGVDFNSNGNASCAIIFDSAGTIAADRVPGQMLLQTATDAAPSVLTTAVTISPAQAVTIAGIATVQGASLTVGVTGTTTGTLKLAGATSGVVTVTPAAVAGTWTMTLPDAANTNAGYQLTCAAGDSITSWGAAASLRELKDIQGEHDAADALDKLLKTKVYDFRYKPGKGTQDSETLYVGVMADEAPWAMHYQGGVVSPINTFGYSVLAIQALNERLERLERAA